MPQAGKAWCAYREEWRRTEPARRLACGVASVYRGPGWLASEPTPNVFFLLLEPLPGLIRLCLGFSLLAQMEEATPGMENAPTFLFHTPVGGGLARSPSRFAEEALQTLIHRKVPTFLNPNDANMLEDAMLSASM